LEIAKYRLNRKKDPKIWKILSPLRLCWVEYAGQ
jgi:hypothetical protein